MKRLKYSTDDWIDPTMSMQMIRTDRVQRRFINILQIIQTLNRIVVAKCRIIRNDRRFEMVNELDE